MNHNPKTNPQDPETQKVMGAYEAVLSDAFDQELSLMDGFEKKIQELLEFLDVESPSIDDQESTSGTELVEPFDHDERWFALKALRAKRRQLTLSVKALSEEGQALLNEPVNAEYLREWRALKAVDAIAWDDPAFDAILNEGMTRTLFRRP